MTDHSAPNDPRVVGGMVESVALVLRYPDGKELRFEVEEVELVETHDLRDLSSAMLGGLPKRQGLVRIEGRGLRLAADPPIRLTASELAALIRNEPLA